MKIGPKTKVYNCEYCGWTSGHNNQKPYNRCFSCGRPVQQSWNPPRPSQGDVRGHEQGDP